MNTSNDAPKKKLKKRTKFTMLAIFNITWYAIVVLILSFYDKTVPGELTASWFAAWTAELALLFGIKVSDKNSSGFSQDYDVIEKEDGKIEEYNTQIDTQNEESVPDYDEAAG